MGAGLVAADINHRYFLLAGSARAPPRCRALASPCQEAVNNLASRADVRTRQEAIPEPSPAIIPFDGSTSSARFSRTRSSYTPTTAAAAAFSGSDRAASAPKHARLVTTLSYNARHRTLMIAGCAPRRVRLELVTAILRCSFSFLLSSFRFVLVSFSAVNHESTDRKNHPEFPQRDEANGSRRVSFHSAFRVSCQVSRDLSVLAIVLPRITLAGHRAAEEDERQRFPRIFAPR